MKYARTHINMHELHQQSPQYTQNRSEGFPLTCYFIPVRDGAAVGTFGNLRSLPAFKQEAIIVLKHTKRTHVLKQMDLLVTISTNVRTAKSILARKYPKQTYVLKKEKTQKTKRNIYILCLRIVLNFSQC